jgi:redox-sensitive bicupin YhaK (pirin superfamily)
VEIVAGSIGDLNTVCPAPDSWASDEGHEVAIWYFQMEKEARWSLPPASEGVNRTLYFFEGETVDMNGQLVHPDHMVYVPSTNGLSLINGGLPGRFLYLQGRPINEPVVNFGPFVMNSREEIQETYRDYQETRFGGWPWPRHDHVHPKEKDRFARYPDGREEFPRNRP